jgi:hypothetical protein
MCMFNDIVLHRAVHIGLVATNVAVHAVAVGEGTLTGNTCYNSHNMLSSPVCSECPLLACAASEGASLVRASELD